MTTRTMSLEALYKACLDKAASIPMGHNSARNRLYEAARQYAKQIDMLYEEDDYEGPVGCRIDESWLR